MTTDAGATRTEHDSLGEVAVPASAKWAAQTQRAVDNFPISGRPIDRRLIRALGLIKAAGARVNARIDEVSAVSGEVASAIDAAGEEVAEGRWDAEFPVDVFQTGSGTSSNMNANEVIARLASERLGTGGAGGGQSAGDVGEGAVHPNDQVNASQSSNDVFPTAVHLAAAEAVTHELLPALDTLTTTLAERAGAFSEVVKAGRTHLMDATPVTLGQEFGGYAAQLTEANERFRDSLGRLARLPIGGTAVGTGINAPNDFGAQMVAELGERTGLLLVEAPDHFAAQGARDGLVETSGQLRALATALTKIANDVRWLSSGPRCGLAEIRLPALQPGSSIMPGKVNPVLAETVVQVAGQVIGNDAAIAFGNSQGNLELNVTMPMMARNLLESVELLSNAMTVFAERCVAGIEADEDRCRELAETSPSVVTSLNPVIGYEAASEVVKESLASGRSIREVILERELLGPDELDDALDVMALTRGGLV